MAVQAISREREDPGVLDQQWQFLDAFCERQASRLRDGQGRDDDDEQVPFELHASIAQRELQSLRERLEQLETECDQLRSERDEYAALLRATSMSNGEGPLGGRWWSRWRLSGRE